MLHVKFRFGLYQPDVFLVCISPIWSQIYTKLKIELDQCSHKRLFLRNSSLLSVCDESWEVTPHYILSQYV
jgi:hypothetical protein